MNTADIMMFREAAYSVGLENGWTKEQIEDYIRQTTIAIMTGKNK